MTISDLSVFSDFYYENPIINDKSDVSPIILDSCEETFLEKTPTIGTITMNLIRYKIPSDAQKINDGMKLAVTVFNVTFTKITVPDNFWVGKTLTNDVWASATYHDVLIYLKLEKIPYGKPEDNASVTLLLIKNQVIRLEDGGY